MALCWFFAVWFVLGNTTVAGVSSKADKLDILWEVLLKSGRILYAIPAIGCFLLPRIICSAMAPRNPTGMATADIFKALPTYRFKLKKNGAGAVGVLAAGTQQELAISEEDAACCICLGKYAGNDELRERPCCHFFQKEGVDEWLKIDARCPLFQSEIGRTHGASTFAAGSSQNPSERRMGSLADEGGGEHGSTVS